MSFFNHKQELYLFKYNNKTFTYTSSNSDFVFKNNVYKPDRFISRTKIVSQGSNNKSPEMKITMSKDSEIASLFKVTSPYRKVELFVYKVDVKNPDKFLTLWSGSLIAATFSKNTVEFDCFSKDQLLDKICGRKTCAYECQHNLFFDGCNLDVSNFSVITNIKNINTDGITIELDDISSVPDGYLKNGIMLKINDENVRMIQDHQGNIIKLLYIMENLKIGDEVRVSWGCSRLPSDCHNKFNNYKNYQGEPFTPKVSPFIGDIK